MRHGRLIITPDGTVKEEEVMAAGEAGVVDAWGFSTTGVAGVAGGWSSDAVAA